MATQEPGQQASLTALPRLEDLPKSGDGYDAEKVREAFRFIGFENMERALAGGKGAIAVLPHMGNWDAAGRAMQADALHLIRAASEFADTVENDAQ